MKIKFLLLIIIQGFLLTNIWAKNLDAHVHGSVNLDMATDKKQLLVMLKSPSESFLGFEYRARNKSEKDKVEQIKNQWNKEIINYLGPQALEDCKITNSNWKQEFSGKNHSTILAESYILCEKKLSGRALEVSFKKKYNNIKEINLQLIREDGSVVSQKYIKETFNLKL